MLTTNITVEKVKTEAGRQEAIGVLASTYVEEKGWIRDPLKAFEPEDLDNPAVAWFIAYVHDAPAGVLRVMYEPPLETYLDYGLEFEQSQTDLLQFIRENKIAEIGRFAVAPAFRKRLGVALMLMRDATRETVERGWTHYVTDVFEGEKHSPYWFHRRVLGFTEIASHDTGELHCTYRRITMLLSLGQGYRRLKKLNNRVFKILTEGWGPELHKQIASGS